MQRTLPVARGPALVAAAVDIGHGVGAALDVGAVQEGPAVVADLLCSVQYQVGFSTVGPEEKRKINGRCQPPILQCCKPHRSRPALPVPVPWCSVSIRCISNCKCRCVAKRLFPPCLCQVATGNSGNNKVRTDKHLLMRGKFGHILRLPSRQIYRQHSTVHATHTESPQSICLIKDETFMQLQKIFPSI